MPSIFDSIFNNPSITTGLGILSGNAAGLNPYASVMGGLQFTNQQRLLQQRGQAQKLAIEAAQRRALQDKATAAIIGNRAKKEAVVPGSAQEFADFNNQNFTPNVGGGILNTPATGMMADPNINEAQKNALSLVGHGQPGIQALNALTGFQNANRRTVDGQSPPGQIAADVKKGLLTPEQGRASMAQLNKGGAAKTITKSVMVDGEPHEILFDSRTGNKIADLGVKPPSAPLIGLSPGLTKAQKGKHITAREDIQMGIDIAKEIRDSIQSGSEPAGAMRTVKGSLTSIVDQFTTAADTITDGAVSATLRATSKSFKSFQKLLKDDVDSGLTDKEVADKYNFLNTDIAVTDLKREMLKYRIARMNVPAGQKLTNQTITEADKLTKLGGLTAGRETTTARYDEIIRQMEAKMASMDELIEGEQSPENAAMEQFRALMKALSPEQ